MAEDLGIVTIRRRAGVAVLTLSTGELLTVPDLVMLRWGLRPELSLPADRWQQIRGEAELELCCNQALRLLEQRAHGTGELTLKLRIRNHAPAVITATISRLNSAGLLNDAAFATAYAEEKGRGAAWGPRRIEQALRRRGISPDDIRTALARYAEESPDGERDAATAIARRKWQSLQREPDLRKRTQKLLAFLLRRGFSMTTARQAAQVAAADSAKGRA